MLKKLVSDNRVFFWAFFGWLAVGAVFCFWINKGEEILWFDARRTVFWNHFFKNFTRLGEEGPYIVIGLYFLIFKNIRQGLTIGLTGFFILFFAFLLKDIFDEPRPGLWMHQTGLLDRFQGVPGVRLLMGASSYPSGHTMGAFGWVSLVVWFSRAPHSALRTPHSALLSVLFILAAVLVGFSRMYLGQHFLEDVLTGAVLGVAVAAVFYFLLRVGKPGWGEWSLWPFLLR